MNRQGRAILAIADKYTALLEAHGAASVCAALDHRLEADRLALLNHARWQMEMVRKLSYRMGGHVSAIRLLGAVQGILIATGLMTVGESWSDNGRWMDKASLLAFESALEELRAEKSV